jgi:hypothetical protein
MKSVTEFIPWNVVEISLRPVDGFWSMNASILFDGEKWIANLRLCDYALPNGKLIRSPKSRPAGNQTKNAIVVFDPDTWKPASIHVVEENDGFPRTRSANVGFEDIRLFTTDQGGLQGIAASLHLNRPPAKVPGTQQHQPPEQVLLSFDSDYNISHAHPIRGDWWSGTPQKNWSPHQGAVIPRFLYSIGKGVLFGPDGALQGDEAIVIPSAKNIISTTVTEISAAAPLGVMPAAPAVVPPAPVAAQSTPAPQRRPAMIRGGEVKLSGRRGTHDAGVARPAKAPPPMLRETLGSRIIGTGRALPVRYAGLRGGTQLVHVGSGKWLGIGHEMNFLNQRKNYWHVWYLVDSRGKMLSASQPMKLSPNGIEFAAGMGIDGDKVVVSYGVDDYECKLGSTSLSAVMDMLAKGNG